MLIGFLQDLAKLVVALADGDRERIIRRRAAHQTFVYMSQPPRRRGRIVSDSSSRD